MEHKLGAILNLYHRADTVVIDDLDRQAEKSYVNSALAKCGYPKWALEKAIPYVKGFSEALNKTYNTYGVNAYF